MTLHVGDQAPEFSLRDQHGQTVSLSQFRGRRNVVLVFYPWAFSSVCSSELCHLRDSMRDLTQLNAQVLAISCDPMFSLRAFADVEDYEFPLLSDFWPHGAASSAYGVFDDTLGCAKRSSFIIDTQGAVAWSVHNAMPDARSLGEYASALETLSA